MITNDEKNTWLGGVLAYMGKPVCNAHFWEAELGASAPTEQEIRDAKTQWDATQGGLGTEALVDKLWRACTDYQEKYFDANGVSGCIGIAVQATLAGKAHTKADANIAWWQALWAEYEARRTALLNDGTAPSLDFSSMGTPSYRVAECVAESQ